MKTTREIFILLSFLLCACTSKEQEALWKYKDLENGAYVRLLSFEQHHFNALLESNFPLQIEVEFVDEFAGREVQLYGIEVSFIDKNLFNGDQSTERVPLVIYSENDFYINEKGNNGIRYSLEWEDILQTLNLGRSLLCQADVFIFSSYLIMKNGQKFSSQNSNISLSNSSFHNFFDFQARVDCFVEEDFYTGTYLLEYAQTPPLLFGAAPYGDLPILVEAKSVAGQNNHRIVGPICVLGNLVPGGSVFQELELGCGKILGIETDTKLRCVDQILVGQGNQEIPDLDMTNDSVFYLHLEMDIYNDCRAGALPFQVMFSKVR